MNKMNKMFLGDNIHYMSSININSFVVLDINKLDINI